MERTGTDEGRPIDVMSERIIPTCFAAALFLSVAVFEVGPLAAPSGTTPARSTPVASSPVVRSQVKAVAQGTPGAFFPGVTVLSATVQIIETGEVIATDELGQTCSG